MFQVVLLSRRFIKYRQINRRSLSFFATFPVRKPFAKNKEASCTKWALPKKLLMKPALLPENFARVKLCMTVQLKLDVCVGEAFLCREAFGRKKKRE